MPRDQQQPRSKTPRRVGIAGYMGAGKSTAARMAARGGAAIIDADAVAKQLMNGDAAIREGLSREFGADVVAGGVIDFPALGRRAFGALDDLQRLNRIVHPALVARLREMVRGAEGPCVLDAALIPLWGIEEWFDDLVWISAAAGIRLERLRTASRLEIGALTRRMRIQEELFAEPCGGAWHRVVNEGAVGDLDAALVRVCGGTEGRDGRVTAGE